MNINAVSSEQLRFGKYEDLGTYNSGNKLNNFRHATPVYTQFNERQIGHAFRLFTDPDSNQSPVQVIGLTHDHLRLYKWMNFAQELLGFTETGYRHTFGSDLTGMKEAKLALSKTSDALLGKFKDAPADINGEPTFKIQNSSDFQNCLKTFLRA